MHVLCLGNKLNEEVCRRFIFANLFTPQYLLVRLWWNILVVNLATNFQDLVTKVKNLVSLAPVLSAISRPDVGHALHFIDASVQIVRIRPQVFAFYASMLHLLAVIIVSEIFTTKRSLKDMHIESIESWPSPTLDLNYHSCNFWNLLCCFGRGDILQQSVLWELQFKLQFIGIPHAHQVNKKICFHFSLLTPLGVIYSIP